jgi:hypothetical protein
MRDRGTRGGPRPVGVRLDGDADELGQIFRRELHRVAEPNDVLRRRPVVDEPAEHRHRIRVVEQPGARAAELGHLVAEREHVLRRSQRPEDAADPERVGDRLAEAVARGNLEVA